jgi:hypothetical protein
MVNGGKRTRKHVKVVVFHTQGAGVSTRKHAKADEFQKSPSTLLLWFSALATKATILRSICAEKVPKCYII